MDKLSDLIEHDGIDIATIISHGRGTRFEFDVYEFTVTLRRRDGDRLLDTPFFMGSAIAADGPTISDVMSCLVREMQNVLYTEATSEPDLFVSFEEWAEDAGYDTDSRRAESIYNEAKKQTMDLIAFLGTDKLSSYMHCEVDD